jgi:SH3-like domain-containing protein
MTMRIMLSLCIALLPGMARALDYVSVASDAAILYDAPSAKAKKLFVVSRYLPLEQVVALDKWVKVRDPSGTLAWIEKRDTSPRHYVLVTALQANVRHAPDENASVVFQAKQNVPLEYLEASSGWIKVRHPDGATGYIKVTEIWGE